MSENKPLASFRSRVSLVLPIVILSFLILFVSYITYLIVGGVLNYTLTSLFEKSLKDIFPEFSQWNIFFLCFAATLFYVSKWVNKGFVTIPTFHNGILKYRGQLLKEDSELYKLGLHRRIVWIMRMLFDGIFMKDGVWWIIPGLHDIKTVEVREKTKKITLRVPMVMFKGTKEADTKSHGLEIDVEYSAYPIDPTEFLLNENSYTELEGRFKGAAMSLATNQDVEPFNLFQALVSHNNFAAAMFKSLSGDVIPQKGAIDGLEEASKRADEMRIKSSDCNIDVTRTGLRVTMFQIEDIRPRDEQTRKALETLSKEIVEKVSDLVEADASGGALRRYVVSMYLPSNYEELDENKKKEALTTAEQEAQKLLADPKRLTEFTKLSLINRGKIKDTRTLDFSFNTPLSDAAIIELGKAIPLLAPFLLNREGKSGSSSGGKKGGKP